MSAENVPKHGKAGVAFAGVEMKDAWLLIGSTFVGLILGSLFGWIAYVGIPLLGYIGTKQYVEWKSSRLPGYFAELLYRFGVAGYSAAFDRKQKLFIGDAKVVNPSALQLGAIVRAEANSAAAVRCLGASTDSAAPHVENDQSELVD
jgi:hypothetical protein